MNEREITTEHCGNEYNHGETKVTNKNMSEWSVEVSADLVVDSADYDNLHRDIQEVIRRYAL